jgi:lysine 6-dehydrogenase
LKKIIILGAGMVGSAMAIDLAINHSVTLTDLLGEALLRAKEKCPGLETIQLDVRDKNRLRQEIQPFDLVICAVPGFLGFETIREVITAGKNLVDISFFPENCLELDALAKENRVTAIVDCGVAPGMGNLILGRYNEILKLTHFECLVGGLPKTRKWPFNYKAPFSPIDVIEEYTRPARYVENGRMITRKPLSDCELVEFDRVGTLEAFNSDGLRSIIHTMPHIPNMKEKTMRYPGHAGYIRVLSESGFFSKEPISVNGREVVPLDVTCSILFNEWKLGETEEELTVMRITLIGENEKGNTKKVVFSLYDEYDPATRTSSMARTTGYTATAAANMLLDGLFSEKGIFPPELIGRHEKCYQYILNYLEERNIHYLEKSEI